MATFMHAKHYIFTLFVYFVNTLHENKSYKFIIVLYTRVAYPGEDQYDQNYTFYLL